MDKVIRDGKVAVLYSPGYGAGWFTWKAPIAAVFHPEIVALVENDEREKITEELCMKLFGTTFYLGGAEDLEIEWIPQGRAFRIEEYDGYESIEFSSDVEWLVA